MKKLMFLSACLAVALLLNGCIALSFGGGHKTETKKATTGQQILDLQKAKAAGAISDAEYETQKAKVLDQK